jgi:15-cis-phytoene synthase
MSTGTRSAIPQPPSDSATPAPGTSLDGEVLSRSRDFCERLTRRQARNFYYGLRLLPPLQRRSMFALYAYMRLVDDIADEEDGRTPAQRQDDLEHWRNDTHAILSGQQPNVEANGNGDGPRHRGREIWPAFFEMSAIHRLPPRIFDDVIEGQRQDLQPVTFASFDQLYEYCYQVAGTVGLASIYIWGFEGGEATELLAVERGLAFQLTNILRDLREDAGRGRSYLPADELAAAGVTAEGLARGDGGEHFEQLMVDQIRRAELYYEKSSALEDRIDRESRPTLVAMTEIYRGLLSKIKADPNRVLRERVSLSLFSKLSIGWRATRAK